MTKIKYDEFSPQQKMSAQTLWGKVILYLREHNDRILHVMCGDIRDVEFEGDEFVISSKEDYVISGISFNETAEYALFITDKGRHIHRDNSRC